MASAGLKVLSLISTALRSAGQLVIFLVLAKIFPVSSFGVFSFYFALAGLCALIGDYGSSTFALPLMSEMKRPLKRVFVEVFFFRFTTSAIAMLVGGTIFAVASGVDDVFLFCACFLTVFVSGLGDFTLLPFRAARAYVDEATASILNTSVYVVAITVVALATHDIALVAVTYLISRLVSFAIILQLWKRVVGRLDQPDDTEAGRRPSFARNLGDHFPYLADALLTASINYLDTLLIGALVSVEAVAAYQIPAKTMQLGLIVVQVAVAIYVPSIVRETDKTKLKKIERRMITELTIAGTAMSIGVAFVLPIFVDFFFHSDYSLSFATWVGFAIALWLRLAASGYGIILIALRRPAFRIIGQSMVLAMFVAATLLSAPRFGLLGVAYSFSSAMFIALLFYVYAVRRVRKTTE
jgi:O-antigen/teichoic acid export membrane protein